MIKVEPMPSIRAIQQGINFLAAIREIDPYISSQTVECLLVIAANPGITSARITELTGLSQAAISRNVLMMSRYFKIGKEGYNLVEAVDDPVERRRKIMFLTTNGQRVVTKIMKTIFPEFVLNSPTSRDALARMFGGT